MNSSRAGVERGQVHLCEVAPRDGLQYEQAILPLEKKVAFIDALSATGLPEIEVGSFVRPDAIPQLANTAEVLERIERRAGVVYSALVPNERGLEGALAAGVDKIAIFTGASESFVKENIRASIAESIDRYRPVLVGARKADVPVRGYISCIVECPYEGRISPDSVRQVASRLLEIGVSELVLGETIGSASPADIDRLLEALDGVWSPGELTLHLHDTCGSAIACALRALQLGVRSFDSSCGGLGGCPFAPGSAGNVATEDLLYLCDGLGLESGVSLESVLEAARMVCSELSVVPRSRLASSCGPQSPAS